MQYIPKQNHEFIQNTISYQGPNAWNSIPFEIRIVRKTRLKLTKM